jgi:hypothetical protein
MQEALAVNVVKSIYKPESDPLARRERQIAVARADNCGTIASVR